MNTAPPSNRDRQFARSLNRLTWRLARNWLKIAIVFFGLYSTLPILTPVLMKLGLTAPAQVLYTVYSPFCHQFAFRSLFLFGEQPAYPREVSQENTLTPFEPYAAADPNFQQAYANWYEFYRERYGMSLQDRPAAVGDLYPFTPWLQFASREFVGNEQMGYKTALCARDVGIYLAMFAGALIYSVPTIRRRLRPIPALVYLVLGLAPIGIDGMSQLLGYPPFSLWAPRETTPIFRIITGIVFGFSTAWLMFPHFDIAMRETAQQIEDKFLRAGVSLR